MSETGVLRSPAMVARSRYVHVRALLVAAIVAIVGLTIAVVLLASSQGGGSSVVPVSAGSSVFQSGAQLDHRGLDTSQSSSAQIGAQLDHRGS
jgi:preprotein translocase subunit SecG